MGNGGATPGPFLGRVVGVNKGERGRFVTWGHLTRTEADAAEPLGVRPGQAPLGLFFGQEKGVEETQ